MCAQDIKMFTSASHQKKNNWQPKIYVLKSIAATLHVFKVCLLIMKANLSLPVVQILQILGLVVCAFRGFVRELGQSGERSWDVWNNKFHLQC